MFVIPFRSNEYTAALARHLMIFSTRSLALDKSDILAANARCPESWVFPWEVGYNQYLRGTFACLTAEPIQAHKHVFLRVWFPFSFAPAACLSSFSSFSSCGVFVRHPTYSCLAPKALCTDEDCRWMVAPCMLLAWGSWTMTATIGLDFFRF